MLSNKSDQEDMKIIYDLVKRQDKENEGKPPKSADPAGLNRLVRRITELEERVRRLEKRLRVIGKKKSDDIPDVIVRKKEGSK